MPKKTHQFHIIIFFNGIGIEEVIFIQIFISKRNTVNQK